MKRIANRALPVAAFLSIISMACGESTTPDAGVLRVSVTTTGEDIDANGYLVTVGGTDTHRVTVGTNAVLTVGALLPGVHDVRLEDVAANCAVEGETARRVPLVKGQPASVDFVVVCAPRAGTLIVRVTTTGTNIPPGPYGLEIDGENAGAIAPNDTLIVAGVREGLHSLRLLGVAEFCGVAGQSQRSVAVAFDDSTAVDFAVTCAAAGTIVVTTTTTGSAVDPDGHIVRADGGLSAASAFVTDNGTATLTVAAGQYTVALLGTSANCAVPAAAGGATRQVEVAEGTSVSVSFHITCDFAAVTPLVFVRAGQIYRVNSDGSDLVRLTEGPFDEAPAWSPDGQRIAFSSTRTGTTNIFVMNADGSNQEQRTFSGYNASPSWSPDGRSIVFTGNQNSARWSMYIMNLDEGTTRMLDDGGEYALDPAWSPDGAKIAFSSDRDPIGNDLQIHRMNLDGSRHAILTTGVPTGAGKTEHWQAAWSPDGRMLAAVSCPPAYYACEISAVVLMNVDGTGLRQLTATTGFARPAWSPDGQRIAFSTGGHLYWMQADGSGSGLIISNGHSPAWRR